MAFQTFNFLVCDLRKTSCGTNVNDLFLIALGTHNGYRNVTCRLGFHRITSASILPRS